MILKCWQPSHAWQDFKRQYIEAIKTCWCKVVVLFDALCNAVSLNLMLRRFVRSSKYLTKKRSSRRKRKFRKKPLTGKKLGRVFWLDFEKAGFFGARKNVGWWDSETAEAASMMNPIPWLVVLQRAAHCPVQRSEGWRAVEFFFDAAAFTDFEAGMFHAKCIWIDVNMLYLGYMAIYYPELWKQLCFEVPEFECPMPGRLWLWIRPSESVLANLQRVCEVQVPGHRCQWNGFGCRGCSLMIYTTIQTKRPCHVFETHPLLLSSSNHIPQVLPQYVQTMESLLPCLDANQFHVKLQQICWINMLCPLDQKFLSAQGHRAWLTGWWFLVFCVSEWYGFMWLLCPFWKVAMTCGFPLEQLFRWRFCLRTFQPENGWCSYQFLHKCKGYV